jgi:hypothetical protein
VSVTGIGSDKGVAFLFRPKQSSATIAVFVVAAAMGEAEGFNGSLVGIQTVPLLVSIRFPC